MACHVSLAGQRRTTRLTSSKLKLLIVGAGSWAHKIEAVCDEASSGIQASLIPARQFLNSKYFNKEELVYYHRIWICTRPGLQIEVLGKLSKYPGIVILEKPYMENSQDYFDLYGLPQDFKSRIILSQPWTFSNAWNSFKKLIENDSELNFEVSRVGQQMHSYINPVADWLPHDLNLILDLVEESSLEVSVTKQQWSDRQNRVQFELSINDTWNFSIDTGLSDSGRISTWNSQNHRIDFVNSVLTDIHGHEKLIVEKHPILDFLNNHKFGTLQKYERNLRFHFAIMNSLGL